MSSPRLISQFLLSSVCGGINDNLRKSMNDYVWVHFDAGSGGILSRKTLKVNFTMADGKSKSGRWRYDIWPNIFCSEQLL
jgi:hypothetical protein